MHRRIILFILLGILAGKESFSQIGGTSVYSFLNVPIAPRVAGAAGSVIANTEDDVAFGFWNPALVNSDMHGQMLLSVAPLKDGVLFGTAAYSHTFEKAGSFFAGVKYVDYGSFVQANNLAQVTGSFTAADYAFQLGYGYELDSNWQFGVSMKLINSTYESYISWGLATDIAAVYQIPRSRLAMTLMLRNAGFQLSAFNQNREPLPLDIRFGISTRFKHVPLRLNLMLDQLQQFDLRYNDPNNVTRDPVTGEETVVEETMINNIMRHVLVAAEIAPSKNFNIQLGYSFRRGYEMQIPTRRSFAGLTFGIGFKISKFRINYANTNMNVAGRMNHFSITTSLGAFKRKAEPTPNN
jgi:hypothetical protein